MTVEDWRGVFLPLLFTVTIEWVLFIVATREGVLQAAGFVLLTNLITWPVATLLNWSWPAQITMIELLVLAVESLLIATYWRYHWLKSGVLSLTMNSASYLIGRLIFQ